MRISDWSSDVCSSDLAEGGVSQLARKRERGQIVGINQTDSARITHPLRERIVCSLRGFEGVAASMYVGAKYLSRLTSLIEIVAETPMKISYACLADKSAGQIGRGSCRERVGQYV